MQVLLLAEKDASVSLAAPTISKRGTALAHYAEASYSVKAALGWTFA